ncbi:hypothetical protein ColKHC_05225 [Colletotrichum higginsianum]|nr:hypothetical protein ColKHC_05225 [Colletotrichum higginsianum]
MAAPIAAQLMWKPMVRPRWRGSTVSADQLSPTESNDPVASPLANRRCEHWDDDGGEESGKHDGSAAADFVGKPADE